MPSLDENFDKLFERIHGGRDITNAGFDPVYYLVFAPSEILAVKRRMKAWQAKLKNEGWDVTVFSMAEAVLNIHSSAKVREIWIDEDRKAPLDWDRTNTSMAGALESNNLLQSKLKVTLESSKENAKGIVLVTDLEALHPYIRIGDIESALQGHFCVPTVFFYPGVRAGATALKFLGFYSEGGNYRSLHIGG